MPSIELVMIVRDEARCLARCLASAKPWVDGIVVVDTGSVDDTAAIARAHGARVSHFEWIHDFAAARNAALDASDADWRLVLDADEWIEGEGASLATLRSRHDPAIGQVRVVSRFDAAGGGEAPSWLPRLLPRGVRYEGRVHEQPTSTLPRFRLPLSVGHDGYLEAQRASKLGRNERLLALALEGSPGDAYLHYQMGKDLELGGRFAEASAHYEQAFAGADARAGWRHDLVLRLLFTLKRLDRFDAAVPLAEAEMANWNDSPDFFFTLGDLLLGWAAHEPARGPALLPMIESSWLRALEIGERPELQDTVRGRGSFLAAHNLAVLHQSLGDEAAAGRWRAQERSLREAGLPA